MLKECSSCRVEKPNTIKYYGISKRYGDGFKLICRECLSEKNRKIREWKRKTFYGVTEPQYIEMINSQKGLCKICGMKETKISFKTGNVVSLAIDHCHKTGVVRGLLCAKCNLMLGYARDNTDILKSAIKYLDKFK